VADVIVVGLSHQTAPIEVRERLAIPPKELGATLTRLHALDEVSEAIVLSTCNRVEVFAVPAHGIGESNVIDAIIRLLASMGGADVVSHLVRRHGEDALRHVFRVAASLDSLVVGEPQILGQLKSAIRAAADATTLGPELSVVMRSALHVAKKVRSGTSIGTGQVSVPSVAIDLARHIFEDLRNQTVLLVGAGEMAESAARLLAREGATLVVCNRSGERADKLAANVGGTPMPWRELLDGLTQADIVIASTASPRYVVTKKHLKTIRRKRRGRSLFLIDIAVPRDVEPSVNDLENVYLYDIDDLSHVVAQSLEGRRGEADRAEQLVLEETNAFTQRVSQLTMKPVIVAMRQRTRELLSAELHRSYKGRLKHLADDDRKALQVMMDAAVNKLLHAPTQQLKQLASTAQSQEVASLMCRLFDLEQAVGALQADAPEIESAELPPDSLGDAAPDAPARPDASDPDEGPGSDAQRMAASDR
jgi:glutamyl-tRNA reductase